MSRVIAMIAVVVPLVAARQVGGQGSPPPLPIIAQRGQKICQLIGECDRQRGGAGQCTDGQYGQPTLNLTESRYGLFGTDLGASFAHNGRVYFLFGDTIPSGTINPPPTSPPHDSDSIASSQGVDPEDCLDLQFVTSANGYYLPPQIQIPPGDPAAPVHDGTFETPTGGFSTGGKMYIFRTVDPMFDSSGAINTINRSILAGSVDDAQSFTHVYDVSTDKFINIAPAVVNNADIPGLPTSTGQGLLAWASSKQYRHSDPYLAYVPLASVEDRSAWQYFAGLQGGLPTWDPSEATAVPVFSSTTPCIGELSVDWNPYLRVWVMLYNCLSPRGINLRVARQPWGPWSAPGVIFDPVTDDGYCHFIHWSNAVNPTPFGPAPCDNLSDPGAGDTFGGEYGPYIISSFTRHDAVAKSVTIYYTMSTFNPYTVVLMKTTFETVCGNGVVEAGEQCDDGNTVAGDGCDSGCGVETCFDCAGEPSSCTPVTTCVDGDGCCPDSCNADNDGDCAREGKCPASKVKAIAKKESGKLACRAKAAAKADPSRIAPCDATVEGKYQAAFIKAGSCTGDESHCEAIADKCVTDVAAALPDAGKCEAAKLKAGAKKTRAALACYAKAVAGGSPVDDAPGGCLDKAAVKFAAAMGKADSSGPCAGDESSVEMLIDTECVNAVVGGSGVTGICP